MKFDLKDAVVVNSLMFILSSILLGCTIGHLTTAVHGWLAWSLINVVNCWMNDFTLNKYF